MDKAKITKLKILESGYEELIILFLSIFMLEKFFIIIKRNQIRKNPDTEKVVFKLAALASPGSRNIRLSK